MNCKNCGEIINGQYCSHCGQNTNVGKITMSSLANEFSESLLQVNKGFFFTVKELFTRPGKTILEYLKGKRKNHFKPITYALTLSTIYYLVSQASGQNTWMDDLISGFSKGVYESTESKEIPAALIWFSKNFAYTTLLLLPVFSLASYLAFRSKEQNYLEHLVINAYTAGQQAIFYTLFCLIQSRIKSEVFEWLPIVSAFFYAIWVFWQIFEEGSRFSNVLRTIWTYILYLFLSTVLLLAIMGITEVVGG